MPRTLSDDQWKALILVLLVLLEVGLLFRLLPSPTTDPSLLLAIVFIAVLAVLLLRIGDLASLSVGKEGIAAQLQAVNVKADQANRAISELFLLTMSERMFSNLRKLVGGHFGEYDLGPGLERELRHLRDVGYVEVEAIGAIPKHGTNLSDWVQVTAHGKKFVEMRDALTPSSSNL